MQYGHRCNMATATNAPTPKAKMSMMPRTNMAIHAMCPLGWTLQADGSLISECTWRGDLEPKGYYKFEPVDISKFAANHGKGMGMHSAEGGNGMAMGSISGGNGMAMGSIGGGNGMAMGGIGGGNGMVMPDNRKATGTTQWPMGVSDDPLRGDKDTEKQRFTDIVASTVLLFFSNLVAYKQATWHGGQP